MFSISLLTTLLLSMSYDSAIAQNTSSSGNSIASLAAGLSTSCQAATGSLLTSDFGSCANIIGLASVIGASGSIIPPLNNWITAICSADPCSNSTLSSAQQTITSNCGADAQKGSPIASGLTTIVSNYGSVRNILCTKYVANSTLCVTSILENIQTASGQSLSLPAITSFFSTGFSASSLSKVPASTYCNDCGHAIVTLSQPLTAATNASMTASMSASMPMSHNTSSDSVANVCGASFNDGKVPSSVKIDAKGSSAAAGNAQNSAGTRQSAHFFTAIFVTLASSLLYLAC